MLFLRLLVGGRLIQIPTRERCLFLFQLQVFLVLYLKQLKFECDCTYGDARNEDFAVSLSEDEVLKLTTWFNILFISELEISMIAKNNDENRVATGKQA
ncbi:hypothetical protein LINGRAHAP2_LOCUS29020 [Linum grandiflorum]